MAIRNIDKLLERALMIITRRPFLDKLGSDTVKQIKKRTRLGFGVREPEAQTNKLPDLQPQTVRERKRLKRNNKLTGPRATPTKSGINRTGSTLESLDYNVVGDEIQIRLSKDGERVATELIDLDRDYTFMNLSKGEVNEITKVIEDEIVKELSKIK